MERCFRKFLCQAGSRVVEMLLCLCVVVVVFVVVIDWLWEQK